MCVKAKRGFLGLMTVSNHPTEEIDAEIEGLRCCLGDWLAVNGEAIFDTVPWTVAEAKTRDGLKLRFTQKDGTLYAILLARPETASITLDTPKGVQPQAIHLLGEARPLQVEDQAGSLTIHLPEALAAQPVYAFRISR
jgi:alpha-L-fucosidase